MPGLRDPLKFPAWAYRIINNQCLDALRKLKNMEPEQGQRVVFPFRELEQLSHEHRSVLALHYLQGFDVKEIARILRKPQGTVKSRLFNAREKFKTLFIENAHKPDNSGIKP